MFACPLEAKRHDPGNAPFKSIREQRALGLSFQLPGWLKVSSRSERRVDFASPHWRLSLRRSALVPLGTLNGAKKALESYELGQTLNSIRCERATLTRLLPRSSRVYTHARFGTYPRRLAQRRRVWALFLQMRDGTALSAVVTGFWGRGKGQPDLDTVSRIFYLVARGEPVSSSGMDDRVRPLGKNDVDALQ